MNSNKIKNAEQTVKVDKITVKHLVFLQAFLIIAVLSLPLLK